MRLLNENEEQEREPAMAQYRSYTEDEIAEARRMWAELNAIVKRFGELGVRPRTIAGRIDGWGDTPELAPEDDERMAGLAEAVHTAWRKGCDHSYASAIHRLISEMHGGDWAEYIRTLDSYLREIHYTPEM